jgi:hypothetical protein
MLCLPLRAPLRLDIQNSARQEHFPLTLHPPPDADQIVLVAVSYAASPLSIEAIRRRRRVACPSLLEIPRPLNILLLSVAASCRRCRAESSSTGSASASVKDLTDCLSQTADCVDLNVHQRLQIGVSVRVSAVRRRFELQSR